METGKSNSGRARMAKLTPEQRSELASKAAKIKAENLKLPKATHSGTLKLIETAIPCAVLEDGTRVLTQSNFMAAMGMYYSGWISKNAPEEDGTIPAGIPHFLAQKSLLPFINNRLGHLQEVVLKYRSESGVVANGIKAEIIPFICDIYLDAEKVGSLGARQKKIAQQAMLLMRALAHVGIVALVDEATGYQKDRAKDALAQILEKFVAKELQPWLKTFPAEYYEHLFRLYGIPFPPERTNARPQFFGRITNNVVYERLAPELLPELKKAASKAEKKARLHQWLTSNTGHPKLREHLSSIITLLKLARTPQEFRDLVDRIHPPFGSTMPLDFGDLPST